MVDNAADRFAFLKAIAGNEGIGALAKASILSLYIGVMAGMDRETYLEIMRAFPTGIAVVTAVDEEGAPRGLTTNAVTSVSAEPPLLLVCVDLESRTLPAIRHSGGFVVNFMAAETEDVCRLFASKAEDKFSRLSWESSTRKLPVLHMHTLAWAECSVERELQLGDHAVFVGLVENGETTTERSPMAYFSRAFDRLVGASVDTSRP